MSLRTTDRASSRARRPARLAAAALAVAAVLGLAACTGGGAVDPTPSPTRTSQASLPTGTTGDAHFTDGYLQVGNGQTDVDVYLDPLCPYCGEFEKANGQRLAALVDDGTISLRLHPLTFLDPRSNGSQYSTRAAGALTCVAADDPTATLDYLRALYANQPEEGSTGLTDSQLVTLAARAGASGVGPCIRAASFGPWAQHVTQQALTGPLPETTELASIQGTPTILIDGHVYSDSITDTSALVKAIEGGGS